MSKQMSAYRRLSLALPAMIACCFVLNAFLYTYNVANPVIQSDAWRYMDGFLGRSIESGLSLRDMFVETSREENNFVLYKLALLGNARFMSLDFRAEGILAVLVQIACVFVIARLAGGPLKRWGAVEWWFGAVLSMCLLSLNASNNYQWPLAMMWSIPIILALVFCAACLSWTGWRAFFAALLLGILLDEVAIGICLSMIATLFIVRRKPWRSTLGEAFAIALGCIASRVFYLLAEAGGFADGLRLSLPAAVNPLFSTGMWKAIVIPLAGSLVQGGRAVELAGHAAPALELAIALALMAAHAWFWLRVRALRIAGAAFPRSAAFAVGMMLLCYMFVGAIIVSRVPLFGYDYLRQPRYALFYQLQLAALLVMGVASMDAMAANRHDGTRFPRSLATIAGVAVAALIGLQVFLSHRAWQEVPYVRAYNRQAAGDIFRLAADPERTIQCAAYVRVCAYPAENRRRIMRILQVYRLNVFSPRLQWREGIHPPAR